VKFTPKGGKIMVSAKMTENKSVEISIKDTGIGMDKSILDNLFRLDINTCRKGTEGELSTGLGLLLCKDFIEKHGGKLCIESHEGMGSTFHFTIPNGE
jgi:signal transduction histidine kinase